MTLEDSCGSILSNFAQTLKQLSEEYSHVLASKYFEVDLPSALSDSLERRLYAFILRKLRNLKNECNFYDHIFIEAMICWSLQLYDEAQQCILAAVVSLFGVLPSQASSELQVDEKESLSKTKLIYFLVLATQLQLLLWVGGNAKDGLTFSSQNISSDLLKPSLVLLMGSAIRAATLFGSLHLRWDIVCLLLQRPLTVLPAAESEPQKRSDSPSHVFEIPRNDLGYSHFVNLSRSEAIQVKLSSVHKFCFFLSIRFARHSNLLRRDRLYSDHRMHLEVMEEMATTHLPFTSR